MWLSRRRLLWTALACGGAAAAVSGAWRAGWRGASGDGPLPHAEPAPISDGVAAALVAAAETAIGMPVETSHYAEYYRWRAEHLGGYAALYAAFATAADRAARAQGTESFAEASAQVRRSALGAARLARDPRSLADRVWAATSGRPWRLYDRYILAEGLALFARTDAWPVLAYRGWPGQARGLDRYVRAPA